MEFHDSSDQAKRIAEAALKLMAEHRVPSHPKNFMIWYCYAGGSRPDVVKGINVLLGNKAEFGDAVNEDLFQQYFGDGDQTAVMAKTTEGLKSMLENVGAILGEAGSGARNYGETLKSANTSMQSGGKIQDVISRLMSETTRMAQQNAELQGELTKSSKEVDSLRETLASVERDNLTDGLTGINNRKVFDRQLKDLVRQTMEDGEDLRLIMLDIDFFKKFNDSFGHQVGDQVLKLVAKTMETSVRPLDVPARYGGEEFAVVMPMAKLEDAVRVANEIRIAVSSKKIIKRSTGDDLGQVTLSAWIAQFILGEPVVKLIQRADAALYHAKRTGRNRVATENELDSAAKFAGSKAGAAGK